MITSTVTTFIEITNFDKVNSQRTQYHRWTVAKRDFEAG